MPSKDTATCGIWCGPGLGVVDIEGNSNVVVPQKCDSDPLLVVIQKESKQTSLRFLRTGSLFSESNNHPDDCVTWPWFPLTFCAGLACADRPVSAWLSQEPTAVFQLQAPSGMGTGPSKGGADPSC